MEPVLYLISSIHFRLAMHPRCILHYLYIFSCLLTRECIVAGLGSMYSCDIREGTDSGLER